MYIDKNSLKITANGSTLNLANYITKATYSYNKLWASDSGRNLAGSMTGSLVGIFPKIVVTFRGGLSKTEIETLASYLDSSTQTVSYYDAKKKAQTSMQTYTGDWEVEYRGINKHDSFTISFISRKKRS